MKGFMKMRNIGHYPSSAVDTKAIVFDMGSVRLLGVGESEAGVTDVCKKSDRGGASTQRRKQADLRLLLFEVTRDKSTVYTSNPNCWTK